MEKVRYKMTLAYDGSGFSGWQRQPEKPTVQGAVEDALYKIYGTAITVTASGRTDEGVHAYGQVMHFDASERIAPDRLIGAVNFYLPQSVRILDCVRVPEVFHARKSAKKKTYVYDMYISDIDNPFLQNRAARLNPECDTKKMKAAAEIFIGTHDFKSFRCKGSTAQTTVRTVTACDIREMPLYGERGVRLSVTANGFLYKMVRILAGTLMRIGDGTLSAEELQTRLDSGEEWEKKFTAPAYGLYLYRVEYGSEGNDRL